MGTEKRKKVLMSFLIISFLLITAISPITQASFMPAQGFNSTLNGIFGGQQNVSTGIEKYQSSPNGGFKERALQDNGPQNYIESTLDIWNNTILQGNVLSNTTLEPNSMAFDPLNNYTYVTDEGVNGVTVLNSTNVVIGSISVGPRPTGIVYDPINGEVYVANAAGNTLSVIASNNQVKANITVAPSPNGIAFDPVNGYLYVACFDLESGGMVTVINSTNNIVANISVYGNPQNAAFDSFNNYIYVTTKNGVSVIDSSNNFVTNISGIPYAYGIAYDPLNDEMFISHEFPWSVAILNSTNSIVLNISYSNLIPDALLFNSANGYIYIVGSLAYGGSPIIAVNLENNIVSNFTIKKTIVNGAAYDPISKTIYAISYTSNTPAVIYIINPSNQIIDTIGISSSPTDIVYDSFNQELYISEPTLDSVGVIGPSGKIIKNISVGSEPNGILYDPYDKYIYVTDSGSSEISVIDASNSVIENIVLPSNSSPNAITLDTETGNLYVVTGSSYYLNYPVIYVINPVSGSLVSTFMTQYPPNYIWSSIAYDSENGYIYTASLLYGVTVINSSGYEIAKIPMSVNPEGVAYNPNNHLIYVTEAGSSSVCVINSLNEIVGNVTVGFNSGGISYDSWIGGMLVAGPYPSEYENEIALINSNNSLTSTFLVGYGPMSAAYDSYNGNIYVANGGSETVSIIAKSYSVNFDESGLLSGTSWSVTLSGKTKSSNSSEITFSESNGTYPYSIGIVAGYIPSVQSGQVIINGTPVSLQVTFTAKEYVISFLESGLPSGATWNVTLNGAIESSSISYIKFTEPNGSYSFTVGVYSGYSASPYYGTIIVKGSNVSQSITFSLVKYIITFKELGLHGGSMWYVTFNGTTKNSTSDEITFSEPNGTYSFQIMPPTGYTASPLSGTLAVKGLNVTETIIFTPSTPRVYSITFTESGLPSNTPWSVVFNGTMDSSTNGTITFTEPNGTYLYTVGNVSGYSVSPLTGTVTVSAKNVSVSVAYTPVKTNVSKYTIIISESGIPSGTSWSVTLTGTTFNGQSVNVTISLTNSTVIFDEPNGTYSYVVHLPSGYTSSNSKGTLNVSGASATSSIEAKQTNTTVNNTTNYLIYAIIAVVIIIAVVGAVFAMRRRR